VKPPLAFRGPYQLIWPAAIAGLFPFSTIANPNYCHHHYCYYRPLAAAPSPTYFTLVINSYLTCCSAASTTSAIHDRDCISIDTNP
jgi:hypothetical protein